MDAPQTFAVSWTAFPKLTSMHAGALPCDSTPVRIWHLLSGACVRVVKSDRAILSLVYNPELVNPRISPTISPSLPLPNPVLFGQPDPILALP